MPDQIEICRQAALALLKPSPRDLQHGLEVHARSLVVDSYGFAPRAARDGEAYQAAWEAGASDLELKDLDEEQRQTRVATDVREREAFRRAWEAAGVTCILQNAGEEGESVPRLLKRLARFTYVTDLLPDLLARALTPADIRAAHRAGKRCLYLTCNGVPLAGERYDVHHELGFVRIFFQLGARMMHLTYNRRNSIGEGCAEAGDGGLSDFGRQAVAELNRAGIIPDVAHSSWKTCLDACAASSKPVAISHATCHARHAHIRAKSDEAIKAVAGTGGFMGVCGVPAFLGGTGDIRALLDHLVYLKQLVGCDHIAIGTDVAHASPYAQEEQAKIAARGRRQHPRWGGFWPPGSGLDDPAWNRPEQKQSLAWTNFPLFTVGLVQRGFSEEEIRKVLGENVLRVAEATLPQEFIARDRAGA